MKIVIGTLYWSNGTVTMLCKILYIIVALAISRHCSKDGQPSLNSIVASDTACLHCNCLLQILLPFFELHGSIIRMFFFVYGDHTVLEIL